jgi:hypothetical protein
LELKQRFTRLLFLLCAFVLTTSCLGIAQCRPDSCCLFLASQLTPSNHVIESSLPPLVSNDCCTGSGPLRNSSRFSAHIRSPFKNGNERLVCFNDTVHDRDLGARYLVNCYVANYVRSVPGVPQEEKVSSVECWLHRTAEDNTGERRL